MNGVKGRLLSDWAQVLAWNIIRCVIVEERAGEIIEGLLRRTTRDSGRGELTRGTAMTLASLSRALSIAASPEAATPKSSATVEALAVIIGITNRVNYGLWQSA